MGFQDNSGDIIFDVVLTDEGRRRLARGDGSFNVSHFALGDEEINYALFNTATGSAYQDIKILQTPILEAFTNNTSTMKSKLLTLTENNILYLPTIKLNELQGNSAVHSQYNMFLVAVDGDTEDNNGNYSSTNTALGLDSTTKRPASGIIWGEKIKEESTMIRIDAGLDTSAIAPSKPIPAYAAETQFIVEMDNRLGYPVSWNGSTDAEINSVDDDNIASYSFSSATENALTPVWVFNNSSTVPSATQVIAGPRSTYLQFKIASSANLRQSNYLFDLLGGTCTLTDVGGASNTSVKYIDSIVKITGFTTGYSVDIPIRYIKL